MTEDNLKLCYVSGNFAFFTSQALDIQWGDDWEDAPYEHNAGEPYEYDRNRDDRAYKIVKIAYDGPLYTPSDGYMRASPPSVKDINIGCGGKKIPWLSALDNDPVISIYAGECIDGFIDKVKAAGGNIYVNVK